MKWVYGSMLPVLWTTWAIYWLSQAKFVKPNIREESAILGLLHMGPLAFAACLLIPNRLPIASLTRRFFPSSAPLYWSGVGLTVLGLVFSVWARHHLGSNWSGRVTVKDEHELITSGPYAIVRHPIYTGLILAYFGSALTRMDWRALIAVTMVLGALWRKLKLEEKWMLQQFGDRYREYRARSAAILPFLL